MVRVQELAIPAPNVQKKHVIARRAKPDVAIPWIFEHSRLIIRHFLRYLRDRHTSLRTGSR